MHKYIRAVTHDITSLHFYKRTPPSRKKPDLYGLHNLYVNISKINQQLSILFKYIMKNDILVLELTIYSSCNPFDCLKY